MEHLETPRREREEWKLIRARRLKVHGISRNSGEKKREGDAGDDQGRYESIFSRTGPFKEAGMQQFGRGIFWEYLCLKRVKNPFDFPC